jgi:translation initiation factor IF-2
MEHVSQPKVFEFAKEIGMETLALMDKIREWKLPIRSHMAELDADLVEQIKTKLKDDTGKKAEPAKKKKAPAAKKAATDDAPPAKAKATATKAAAAKAPPPKAEAPANKKVAVKKPAGMAAASAAKAEATAAAEKADAAAKAKVVVKKAPAKVVVRRKSDEEEAEAAAAAAALAAGVVEDEPQIEAVAEVEEVVHVAEPVREVAPTAVVAPVREVAVEAPPAVVAAAAEVVVAPPTAGPVAGGPIPGGPGGGPSSPVPSRKREVVMTGAGPSSGIKSEAPRRNIVGRMDLSRVQAPAATGSRPTPGGGPGSGPGFGGPGGPGGPRGTAGPRPLRTGFVASGPVELPPDDSAEGRRRGFEDKRARPKAGPVAGPGAAATTEKEEEVAKFSATEFRKREMVFQPKKKKGSLNRVAMKTEITKPKASKMIVKIDQSMRLSDLANAMGVKAAQLTKALMGQGVSATMNTSLDFDTIALIAPDFGHEAVNVHRTVTEMLDSSAFGELESVRITRPPVVTIMGHVDHGKTSLLDAIRNARVAAGEAGGITQHIGAYQVMTDDGHPITFIDTPGHEAFTAMRARGANLTDIAVIVVAADDGAMPQTVEAVNHAKAAGVPIIVAVNKMDKQGANPERVKQQLTEQQLVPEEWGGDTIYVPVSAVTKEGISKLLEQIYLVAEVEELTSNPKRSATGIVVESRMDKGRGPVATLLVQDGTLKVGDSIIVGAVAGRVRSLINDKGTRVQEAGPSVPVEILGLSEVPQAGDRFDVTEDDKIAEGIANERKLRKIVADVAPKITLEDIFSKLKSGDVKELAIVLKTDMGGSAEAIKGMFAKVGTSEVKIKIVHSAVGGINESDVLLASSAKGIVVGFNVRPDGGAQTAAKRAGVEIKTYTIVYEMMDDLKKALAGLLTPDIVEKQLGRAEVRNTFNVPKLGTIAGCFVTEGKILRSAEVRLLRDGKIIYTGKLASLKRFKDDAKEVAQSFECGIGIENFNDVKIGDVIEAFTKETVLREL